MSSPSSESVLASGTAGNSPTQQSSYLVASGSGGPRGRRSSLRERFSNIFKTGAKGGKKEDGDALADTAPITQDDFYRHDESVSYVQESEADDVRPSIVIDHGKGKPKENVNKDKAKDKEKDKEKDKDKDLDSPPSPTCDYEQQKLVVKTPDGRGVLVRSRPDGMVEVHLNPTTASPLPSPSVVSRDLVTVPIEDDKEVSLSEFLIESRKHPEKFKLIKNRRRSMDVILDYHQRLSSSFDDLEMDLKDVHANLRKYLRAKEKEVISLDDILAEGESKSEKTSPKASPRGPRPLPGPATISKALTAEERETLVAGLKQVINLSNTIIQSLQSSTPSATLLDPRNLPKASSFNSSSSSSSSSSSVASISSSSSSTS